MNHAIAHPERRGICFVTQGAFKKPQKKKLPPPLFLFPHLFNTAVNLPPPTSSVYFFPPVPLFPTVFHFLHPSAFPCPSSSWVMGQSSRVAEQGESGLICCQHFLVCCPFPALLSLKTLTSKILLIIHRPERSIGYHKVLFIGHFELIPLNCPFSLKSFLPSFQL